MQIIERSELLKKHKNSIYTDILEAEKHHNHLILKDEHGVYRWATDHSIDNLVEDLSLNKLCPLLVALGHDKNSELYRELYRKIGYSLSGYWEIFYWDVNNEKAEFYKSPKGL